MSQTQKSTTSVGSMLVAAMAVSKQRAATAIIDQQSQRATQDGARYQQVEATPVESARQRAL